jgi:4a-hydroxytetrahydrobiopterin dehydratase
MTHPTDSDAASDSSEMAPNAVRETLVRARCAACEGGVDKLSIETARQYLAALDHWTLADTGDLITRKINGKSFVKVIEIVNRIAALAEEQQHHPDLHVTGYRHLQVDLTTHAIGGLSQNDFIVAAKIDELLQ